MLPLSEVNSAVIILSYWSPDPPPPPRPSGISGRQREALLRLARRVAWVVALGALELLVILGLLFAARGMALNSAPSIRGPVSAPLLPR
jgi:hypothetical protein